MVSFPGSGLPGIFVFVEQNSGGLSLADENRSADYPWRGNPQTGAGSPVRAHLPRRRLRDYAPPRQEPSFDERHRPTRRKPGGVAPADRAPLLRWMIFTGATIFAAILLWRYGLFRLMLASDRTYISSIVAALYVAASLHCLWRTIVISREGDAARKAARMLANGGSGLGIVDGALTLEG